jgi:hypothetical protein
MGAILPLRQYGERLLSGMAQKPPDDRLGSEAEIQMESTIHHSGDFRITLAPWRNVKLAPGYCSTAA